MEHCYSLADFRTSDP